MRSSTSLSWNERIAAITPMTSTYRTTTSGASGLNRRKYVHSEELPALQTGTVSDPSAPAATKATSASVTLAKVASVVAYERSSLSSPSYSTRSASSCARSVMRPSSTRAVGIEAPQDPIVKRRWLETANQRAAHR